MCEDPAVTGEEIVAALISLSDEAEADRVLAEVESQARFALIEAGLREIVDDPGPAAHRVSDPDVLARHEAARRRAGRALARVKAGSQDNSG